MSVSGGVSGGSTGGSLPPPEPKASELAKALIHVQVDGREIKVVNLATLRSRAREQGDDATIQAVNDLYLELKAKKASGKKIFLQGRQIASATKKSVQVLRGQVTGSDGQTHKIAAGGASLDALYAKVNSYAQLFFQENPDYEESSSTAATASQGGSSGHSLDEIDELLRMNQTLMRESNMHSLETEAEKTKLADLQNSYDDLKADLDRTTSSLKSLRQKHLATMFRFKQRKAALLDTLKEQGANYKEAKDRILELEEALEDAGDANTALRALLTIARKQRDSAHEQIENLRAELKDLQEEKVKTAEEHAAKIVEKDAIIRDKEAALLQKDKEMGALVEVHRSALEGKDTEIRDLKKAARDKGAAHRRDLRLANERARIAEEKAKALNTSLVRLRDTEVPALKERVSLLDKEKKKLVREHEERIQAQSSAHEEERSELQDEIDRLKKVETRKGELEKEVARLEARVASTDKDNASLREKLGQKKEALAKARKGLLAAVATLQIKTRRLNSQMQAERAQFARDLQEEKDKVRDLGEELKRAQTALATAKREHPQELIRLRRDHEEEVKRLTRQHGIAKEALEQRIEGLVQAELRARSEGNATAESLREEIETLKREEVSLQRQHSTEKQKLADEHSAEKQRLQAKHAEAERSLLQQVTRHQENHRKAEEEVERLRPLLEKRTRERDEALSDLDKAKASLEELEKIHLVQAARLAIRKEKIAELTAELAESQRLLREARAGIATKGRALEATSKELEETKAALRKTRAHMQKMEELSSGAKPLKPEFVMHADYHTIKAGLATDALKQGHFENYYSKLQTHRLPDGKTLFQKILENPDANFCALWAELAKSDSSLNRALNATFRGRVVTGAGEKDLKRLALLAITKEALMVRHMVAKLEAMKTPTEQENMYTLKLQTTNRLFTGETTDKTKNVCKKAHVLILEQAQARLLALTSSPFKGGKSKSSASIQTTANEIIKREIEQAAEAAIAIIGTTNSEYFTGSRSVPTPDKGFQKATGMWSTTKDYVLDTRSSRHPQASPWNPGTGSIETYAGINHPRAICMASGEAIAATLANVFDASTDGPPRAEDIAAMRRGTSLTEEQAKEELNRRAVAKRLADASRDPSGASLQITEKTAFLADQLLVQDGIRAEEE